MKILEPSPHQCTKFRPTFLVDGVEYVATTPIRNLLAKTDYHCLKPFCNIKKHPIKKALKASYTHSLRIRKVLKTILTKPQPTPIQPTRFKKEVPNTISFKESCARIQAAQAAAHRAQQLKLRNLLHTKLEERITKEAEVKGIPDCESCC